MQVYIAECVGVHFVGYVFIVYGTASAVASICVGKILGYVSITSVSLLNVCLNVGLVAFLLIWEREPNYFVMFTVAILWGICDGSWTTLTSSKEYCVCIHVCMYVRMYRIHKKFHRGFNFVIFMNDNNPRNLVHERNYYLRNLLHYKKN